jgi:hypothetical protein
MTVRRANPRSNIAFRILKYTSQFPHPLRFGEHEELIAEISVGTNTDVRRANRCEMPTNSRTHEPAENEDGSPRQLRSERLDSAQMFNGRNSQILWVFHLLRKDTTRFVSRIGRNRKILPRIHMTAENSATSHSLPLEYCSRRTDEQFAQPVAPLWRTPWPQSRTQPIEIL